MLTAADFGVPRLFNAATYFVDRHIDDGRGGHVAIECGDERISYAQVAEGVNRFGSALRTDLDVRPEERVALLLHDTPEFAYAFFGAMKIGAVAVPLNTLLKGDDYRHFLADSGAVVLVVSAALLPVVQTIPQATLRRLRRVVVVGTRAPADAMSFDDLLGRGTPSLDGEPTTSDDAAFWLYSSGSTGAPKACVHLHHDMVVCANTFARHVLGITASDRCFSVAKLFFAYGLGNALYFPFSVGATTVLMPGPPAAARVYETIERHRPTLFFSVPTGYVMLLAERRDPEFDLSSIRLAVSAGEALPPALFNRFAERFGLEILDGIGSTEALHMFIANRPGAVRPGSSGRVVPGYEARVLDGDGEPVPVGEVGNLWISGDSVCASYWNQHDKTRDTIQGVWLKTGDKYHCDADGYYWYAGRSDDMLKVGGQWVSPIEVENAMLLHADVQECAVVGYDDGDGLTKPIAFVVLKQEVAGTPERAAALEEFVRSRIADYKRPRRVQFVAELPKTATGKIQRFKLREKARERPSR
ncbi:MAG TPA: benzoate-CoA ligase family protein [Vicinamibacterales bacterium]|nr:benzoate-CoA ligase family protein [Vicinamibacterales bacterium]